MSLTFRAHGRPPALYWVARRHLEGDSAFRDPPAASQCLNLEGSRLATGAHQIGQ
jgi:hypothetical protein